MHAQEAKTEVIEKQSFAKQIIGLFTLSALLLLVGVFALDEWAEMALLNHAVQHLVIFSSGTIMGVTLYKGYLSKKHK